MSFLYSVQQVRDAENALLTQQTETDELMRSAARAVAEEARKLLPERQEPGGQPARVLLLVGPGGNGGDALYAGRDLLQDGFEVTAYAIAGREKTYPTAREAFEAAGGTFLDELGGGLTDEPAEPYDLVIDGLFGLGSRGGIGETVAEFLHWSPAPVLAIDIPSGVAGDTGAVPLASNKNLGIADHVRADVTVTFGGLRRVHGLSAECGRVVCRDIRLRDGQSLQEALLDQSLAAQMEGGLSVNLYGPPAPIAPSGMLAMDLPYAGASGSDELEAGDPTLPFDLPGEPGAASDKYSGGVVGICAGGGQYPGAGILATTGAVRATSSMVRWVGEEPLAVVLSNPEVVAHPSVAECSRVQAWVVGPGRGTDAKAASELGEILEREEPVLVDADGLTLLAENPELMGKLRARGAGGSADGGAAAGGTPVDVDGSGASEGVAAGGTPVDVDGSGADESVVGCEAGAAGVAGDNASERLTILTPHAGEFARLAKALGLGRTSSESGEGMDRGAQDEVIDGVDKDRGAQDEVIDGKTGVPLDRIEAAALMARELGCTVLLKGRFTVITDGVRVDVVDAGSSWAATAGSGDVLAGIIGALLAERGRTIEAALVGQFIHAVAAYESARTSAGFAPTSASRIAAKIPEAIALLGNEH